MINFIKPNKCLKRRSRPLTIHALVKSKLWLASLLMLALVFGPSLSLAQTSLPAPTILSPGPSQTITSNQPYIRGVTLNSSNVEVYIDDKLSGRAIVADHPSGTASFAYQTPPLTSGRHLVHTVAKSSDGTISSLESIRVAFDFALPLPAPTLVTLKHNSQAWQKPLITGVTVSNTEVEVYIDGQLNGRIPRQSHASGAVGFAYEPFLHLEPGWHSIKTRALDPQGKKSGFSNSLIAQIQIGSQTPSLAPASQGAEPTAKTALAAPTLVAPATGSVLSQQRPAISGLAHNNETVEFFIDGQLAGSLNVGAHPSGVASFAYRPNFNLESGTHSIYTRSRDAQGRISGHSNSLSFFVSSPNSFRVSESRVLAPGTATLAIAGPDESMARAEIDKEKEDETDRMVAATSTEDVMMSEDGAAEATTTVVSATADANGRNPWLVIIIALVVIALIALISWFTTKPINDQPAASALPPPEIKTNSSSPSQIPKETQPSVFDPSANLPPPPPPPL